MRINGPVDPVNALPARFRRLLVAWAASLTGDGLRLVALPLLAVSVNPSPSAVALVAVASALPWLVVAIPAGALVDRFDPAKVMATAHLVRAVLTLSLMGAIVAGAVTIPVLCLVGFAVTSAETFADGSAQSLLVRIVPQASLERANARFVTVETLALDLAGPLTAGALFVLAPWAPFALSALCFVIAAAVIGTVRTGAPSGASSSGTGGFTAPEGGGTGALSAWASIRAGLGKLFGDSVLRVLVITVAIMAVANAATDAVLVLYGTQTLGMSEAFYPTLLVAYSVGTLAAAALVGRANSRVRGGQVMIIALFGISATMLILGLVPVVVVALAAFAVMGLAGGTWNVLSATRRQRRTPHDMIGRVSSAFRVVAWGVIPIGAALGGVVGERYGVSAVYLCAGAVIALLGVVVARSFIGAEPAPAPAPDPQLD
ncbi:MAG: MFS transporter [Nakamurella sp.]